MNNYTSPVGEGVSQQQAIRARLVRSGSAFSPLRLSEVVEQSIPERFEEQARLYPDHVAVKAGEEALTYRALNQAANRVAQAILDQRGSGPEPVALLLEHGPSELVALLGVLKAGKFFVALDPSFPRAKNAAIRDDAQAGLIVTSRHLKSVAADLDPMHWEILELEQLESHPLAEANPGLPMTADAIAGIIYTSGSTGQPKGVVQTHRTLLHRFVVETNDRCLRPEDKLTMFHPLGTVAAMCHVLSALLTGGAIFPFDPRKQGVATITDWLLQEGITQFHSTPSLFRRWVETLSGREKFPRLRMIRFGGEGATPLDVELFRKHFALDSMLYVGLGGTEFGTVCRYFIDDGRETPSNRVPMGYPVEGVEVLLLDDAGQEVGFNRAGEIAVRSRYLSPGYWRRPDLTQARFRADPAGGDQRIYLTGDLGLRRPDGCLFHLGRKDFQVKIRGYRIETTEVETALRGMNSIKEAVVMAREDEPGRARLVAYLVPREQPGPTVTDLRRALAEKLPSYMVPSAFVTLEALPVVPNGKVDRQALPTPAKTRPQMGPPFLAPRTPVEIKLAGIWAEVLGVDQVGIDDDFLELGGDSLLATQIISRVINAFEVDLPLRALFAAPTVARMAVIVVQDQANHAKREDVERLLAELQNMSDPQAKQLLTAERAGRGERQS